MRQFVKKLALVIGAAAAAIPLANLAVDYFATRVSQRGNEIAQKAFEVARDSAERELSAQLHSQNPNVAPLSLEFGARKGEQPVLQLVNNGLGVGNAPRVEWHVKGIQEKGKAMNYGASMEGPYYAVLTCLRPTDGASEVPGHPSWASLLHQGKYERVEGELIVISDNDMGKAVQRRFSFVGRHSTRSFKVTFSALPMESPNTLLATRD